MFEGRISPSASRAGFVIGKRVVLGSVLGAWLVVAAPGYAATSSLGATSSTLISQQDSVVADAIKADAEDCATGTKEGTIGNSINQALAIHTELASATPNVETLFSATQDCFSGLSSLFDLSGSIPSLGSILASAQAAVLKYAQKKVCTAVQQVAGMVTTPINQAIGNVGGGTSIGDLNGMTNGLISGGMRTLDPQLGSSYHNAPAGATATYTVDVNPFNYIQTDFGGGSSAAPATQAAPMSAPVTPVSPSPSSSSAAPSSSSGSSSSGGSAAGLFN